MMKVLDKKEKVLMVVASYEKACEGLQKGTYKVGEYMILDETSGKSKKFVKYVCERKSRK